MRCNHDYLMADFSFYMRSPFLLAETLIKILEKQVRHRYFTEIPTRKMNTERIASGYPRPSLSPAQACRRCLVSEWSRVGLLAVAHHPTVELFHPAPLRQAPGSPPFVSPCLPNRLHASGPSRFSIECSMARSRCIVSGLTVSSSCREARSCSCRSRASSSSARSISSNGLKFRMLFIVLPSHDFVTWLIVVSIKGHLRA